MEECLSCKTKIANSKGTVKFMCPRCGKHEIIRCQTCRKTVAKFVCPECQFAGPN